MMGALEKGKDNKRMEQWIWFATGNKQMLVSHEWNFYKWAVKI